MKSWVFLSIFLTLAPIVAYAQTPTNTIIIETFQNSNAVAKATDISVTIQGTLEDNGLVKLFVKGKFGSNSDETRESTQKFTNDNPTHVFELDYPFLKNESYLVTVSNGLSSRTIPWVPLSDTHEQQKQTSTKAQDTSQPASNTIKDATVAVQASSVDLTKSLREENSVLKQESEKKSAVIMEQVKVIQDLALKIKNVIYDDYASKLIFVADTSLDELQSLTEENKLLKQEIEKKNAIIMEQIKVIQDLVSKIKNVIYEPILNHLSV